MSTETAIELEREEFLREVAGEWDNAARKHADFIIKVTPNEPAQKIRNLLAQVALDEAHKEEERSESLTREIDMLQERLILLQGWRRTANRRAQCFLAAHDELIG